MNTMKKEDMIKERGSLVAEIGYRTLGLLTPAVQLISLCQRALYLQSQIDLVTPIAKKETDKDDKMDFKTESDKGTGGTETPPSWTQRV